MAKWFGQYLAICSDWNLPISLKFARVNSKFCQIQNKPLDFLEEIPNVVTLV